MFAGSCQFDRGALAGFKNLIGKFGIWSVTARVAKSPLTKRKIACAGTSFGFGSSELIGATAENSGLLHDLTAIDIFGTAFGSKRVSAVHVLEGRSDIGV